MKVFCFSLLIALLSSCDFKSTPYLKHELSFKKMAGDCYEKNDAISVDANTVGERYVFHECLEAGFNGEYTAERKGDTVLVQIGKKGSVNNLFSITLDINTRPTYHFLTVNGVTVPVTVTRY